MYNPTFTFSPSFETAGPSHCWLPVVIDNKGKIIAKNVQHPHGFEVTDVQEKPIAAPIEPSGVLSVFLLCKKRTHYWQSVNTNSQTQLTGSRTQDTRERRLLLLLRSLKKIKGRLHADFAYFDILIGCCTHPNKNVFIILGNLLLKTIIFQMFIYLFLKSDLIVCLKNIIDSYLKFYISFFRIS